jgi:hypothetical protein
MMKREIRLLMDGEEGESVAHVHGGKIDDDLPLLHHHHQTAGDANAFRQIF